MGAAIWGALGRIAPEQRNRGLFLWLWNPLALWESGRRRHNDAWMALCIVLAVWAFGERRTTEPGAHWANHRTAEPRTENRELSDQATQNSKLKTQNYNITRSLLAFLALTAGGLVKFLSLFPGPVLLGAALRRLAEPGARGLAWCCWAA